MIDPLLRNSSANEQDNLPSQHTQAGGYTALSEADLIALAKVEPDAFGELYERHVDRIYAYIYYRVSNHDDTEDLTARTFFQALQKMDSYEDRGAPFSAWLYRIAHNLVANWHRQQSRRRAVPVEDIDHTTGEQQSPVVTAQRRELQQELIDAIQRLAVDRQELLILKFVERLPNAQIGEMMGRTESSIKSLYHRTLQSLRSDLEDKGVLPNHD